MREKRKENSTQKQKPSNATKQKKRPLPKKSN